MKQSLTTILLMTLILASSTFAEPQKMSDTQLTDLKVQEGIHPPEKGTETDKETDILHNMVHPTPGTEVSATNTPNPQFIETIPTPEAHQNAQELFSSQLFDEVKENNN